MSSAHDDKPLGLGKALEGTRVPADVQRRIVLRAMDNLEQPRRGSLRWVLATGALVAAAVVVGLALRPSSAPTAGTVAVTTTKPQTYELGPHRVQLAAASRLKFSATEPSGIELELQSGKASFQVAKLKPEQHFTVQGVAAKVVVVGTAFEVGADGACTVVRVSEGTVQITPTGREMEPLTAGNERTVCPPAPGTETLSPEERLMRDALGLLSNETRLAEAAALLERYRAEYPSGVFEEDVVYYLCLTRAKLGQADEAQKLKELFLAKFPKSSRGQRIKELQPRSP